MSEIKTGGPAFPLTEDAVNHRNKDFDMQGMTLRDYFAGQALPMVMQLNKSNMTIDWFGEAQEAYKYADAMLKAREATS
jgi:hypothetical protein